MHDEKSLNKLEEKVYKELDNLVEKELTIQNLSLAKELLCVLDYIPKVKKEHHMDDGMMESGRNSYYGYPKYYDIAAYDGYSYDNGMSEMRGRSPMTGRYVSRDDGRMSGDIQPDMTNMMARLMERMDRLEKK